MKPEHVWKMKERRMQEKGDLLNSLGSNWFKPINLNIRSSGEWGSDELAITTDFSV